MKELKLSIESIAFMHAVAEETLIKVNTEKYPQDIKQMAISDLTEFIKECERVKKEIFESGEKKQ